ncbi:MAG: phosphoribosylaminoimidazolesuccinocarboxamide synthase, partial [Pseudomonadales bacterium]
DGSPGILIIATDRISAFDVVLANGLPGKGVVLTQISRFWFDHFSARVRHHLVSTDAADIPSISKDQRAQLTGRVMLCRRTRVIPIECIARGYLAGSGFRDYQATGRVCGIRLPAGLTNGAKLPEALFTPSTKAEIGHDENISYEEGCAMVGEAIMEKIRSTTLDLYQQASDTAFARGIILADTKFEFGLPLDDDDAEPLLIDEILTPDSSRFWPADRWQPGREQESFDKQYVRNYLEELVAAGEWDKTPPGPELPEIVIGNTMDRYREVYQRLTGDRAPV